MSDQELERLVDTVTRQVLAVLRQRGLLEEHEERLLVIGTAEGVPEPLRCRYALCGIEDYRASQSIRSYRRVIVTELTVNQLADIAQGRSSDAESHAVIQALLHGVEVLILSGALPHRRFAGIGSTGLCRLLEGYAHTVEAFGVRLLESESPASPPAGRPGGRMPIAAGFDARRSRLVTEAEALDLARAGGAVHLPAGTVLTPSAWDVFNHAGITVTLDA